MTDIKDLENKYVSMYGNEGCPAGIIETIENALALKLPDDFKQVSCFYSGGLLGGISHHEIALESAAATITEETLRLRESIGLDNKYIVLAEPSESLIVMDTRGIPAVIWCDAIEAEKLSSMNFSTKPDIWSSYADFFAYLLEQDELQ